MSHPVDEGDGIWFECRVAFTKEITPGSAMAVPMWSMRIDGDVLRIETRPESSVTVPIENVKSIAITPRPAGDLLGRRGR